MDIEELVAVARRGEDSRHQFKRDVTNDVSLGQEMVAFSNSGGGNLFVGVDDDGTFSGLDRRDMGRLNQLVSNAASQQVRPPINPSTEIVSTPAGLVMSIDVPDGIAKPYMDKNGTIWVKSGADKRKATAREELQRMFQRAGLIHGDEVPVRGLTVADLDRPYFERFRLPTFVVKGVAFPGRTVDVANYDDSEDVSGKMKTVFAESVAFVMRNLRHVQGDQSVNSLGRPQVPRIVIEELVANALIHRDYFVSAPIIIFIFSDRIEIKNPGHLPNNLTIKNIRMGTSVIRNSVLASYATRILPYRGIGTGIRRALAAYPAIDFADDADGNQFVVTIWLD